jgi:hypothetical protein
MQPSSERKGLAATAQRIPLVFQTHDTRILVLNNASDLTATYPQGLGL